MEDADVVRRSFSPELCSQERGEGGGGGRGGGVVCLATMLTSLTTAGPYVHTHTHTHGRTQRPNQYVTKEGARMIEGVGDSL